MKKILLLNFLMILSITAFAQPANDPYGNATVLIAGGGPSGASAGTNVAATEDGPHVQNCGFPSAVDILKDVWYTIETGATAAELTVEMSTTLGMHSHIDLYTISGGVFTYIDCAYGYTIAANPPIKIEYDALANTIYYVRAYFRYEATGVFDISATLDPISNNHYANAYDLVTPAGVQTLTGQTSVGATEDGPNGTCSSNPDPIDVWYKIETDADYVLNVDVMDLNASPNQVVIDLFTISGGVFTPIDCEKAHTSVNLEHTVSLGTIYYIRVFAEFGGGVPFSIVATLSPTVGNDEVANALTLTVATPRNNQDLTNATAASATIHCDEMGNLTHDDLWYLIQAFEAGGEIEVYIENNAHVFAGLYTEDLTTCVANGSSFFPGSAGSPVLTYTDAPGIHGEDSGNRAETKYYLRITGINTTPTDIDIRVGGTALPIKIETFSAKADERNNLISWSTAAEFNSDYIEVQSSASGTEWKVVGKVDAMGESRELVHYDFTDTNPYRLTYYRLNAVDLDRQSEFSKVISVARKDIEREIHISPNPSSDMISVHTMVFKAENATINIRSLTGKLYISQEIQLRNGTNNIEIDLVDIPNGIYLFELHTATNGVQVEKIVKQ